MPSILISEKTSSSVISFLEQQGFTVTYQPDITPQDLLTAIPEYEALIVRSRTKVTKEIILAGINLKVIGRAGSGTDTIDVTVAKENNVIVVNAPGANSQTVAEHTLTLMLALSRNLFNISTALKQGKWEKKNYQASELSGKTLGVVGFGAIGSKVAYMGHALGMKILVSTRTESDEKKKLLDQYGGKFIPLSELLKQSDVITLHLPASDNTQNLIGEKELAMMKQTSFLVNCARGSLIDEKALTIALQEKRIAGAALDVFIEEPLTKESALCTLENVLLTPHVAATSSESETRAGMMVAEDVVRVLKGENAEHTV